MVIPLNDGGLKGNPFKLGHLKSDTSRSGDEVSSVVTAAIVLILFVVFIPGHLGQFLRLGLPQLIEDFLYVALY